MEGATTIRIWHTQNGIIMGVDGGAAMVASRHGTNVLNPVIVVVNGEGANLMAIYTLTKEAEYFIPNDTLIYAAPKTPSDRLAEAYRAKYMPNEPAMGLSLTTSPRQ